jgi:DNA (cytosine-5)-methyltransferase 1
VDLFCGAGGLTCGFIQAGIPVVVGVDNDPTCRFPFEHNNPGARFVLADITTLTSACVRRWFPRGAISVLAGCAPCQPFSQYTVRENEDERWKLLYEFLRLVRTVRPDVVSMENVPTLKRDRHRAYVDFVEGLRRAGYGVSENIVDCSAYGVPQTRQRFVLLARRDGETIPFVGRTTDRAATVRDAIAGLPRIRAGGPPSREDPLHFSCGLSSKNLARIRATPQGGTWRDWPPKLRLKCHNRITGKWYGSVYGRMAWDEPAPTITTQCFGYGNGRFGHPDQDRAISLREAALLQTFPRNYAFTAPGEIPRFVHVGRHIGNAVPVTLAEALAISIRRSFAA